MSPPDLKQIAARPPPAPAHRQTLGQILVASGALAPADLLRAVMTLTRDGARLGEVLIANGLIDEAQLYSALARQFGAERADLAADPPDPRLIDRYGAGACLTQGVLPWKQVGGATVVATARPERFAESRPALEATFGRVLLAVAPATEIHAALTAARDTTLICRAETRVPEAESCRTLRMNGRARLWLVLAALCAVGLALAAPTATVLALSAWAVATLAASAGLKAAAFVLEFRRARRATDAPDASDADPVIARRPIVSILVPLYRERAIAGRLVRRLGKLTYPKELLDICLVVESDDTVTQHTLANADLPPWMRAIVVPHGTVKTKPRALNYALDFSRGSIVGVYDAEDAPAPDQIDRVVRRFHQRGPDVACLQGVLDFYNARTNWLSRCFAVEYASWFRVILPGLSHMGLVIPLGGTTLFFRREALEALGGWDAHNVTEDADLGIRLARHGYRTELVETVTEEEANCRVWPWIRQRSRWLKGYAMTWAVHMRSPRALWRDLGPWRFAGVQLLFLGTISQFLLAPLLWSFWLLLFGLPHPIAGMVPQPLAWACVALFLGAEVVTISVGMLAVSGDRHRHLMKWVPTLHAYFPLAAIACYRGVLEIVSRPFFWDKTTHGETEADVPQTAEAPPPAAIPPPRSRRRHA